jgi:hypothetical protein
MILIGSCAIKNWYPDFPRKPKDIDYIISEFKENDRINNIEYHKNPILENYNENILNPDDLLTLKVSHLFFDIFWEKHMFDVQFLLSKGCKINEELFTKLYSYWNTIHGTNKRSNLNMSKEDFFNNALNCPYDHDTMHTYLKNPPTYTKILEDGEDVLVSEDKFNFLSEIEKADLVREEVYIMAFERYSKLDYREAYDKMLKKFIINHAPLWEALWIIEHYHNVRKAGFNFIEFLNNKING